MRQVVGIVIALCALGLVLGTLQRLWPGVAGMRRSWRELKTDLVYWLFAPLVTKPLARVAAVIGLMPMLWLLGRPFDHDQLLHGFGPARELPGFVQIAIVAVMGDFIGYWMHRAFHCGWLWRCHAVHHAARELTWMSAARVHPLNDALTRMVQAIPFVAAGFSPLVIYAYLPFLTFYAILLHANLRWDFGPLRYVFASPTFHRWHHSDDAHARDRNFAGLLPLWDWLFGTLYLPHGERPHSFGVQGAAVPPAILAQLVYPFQRNR